MQSGSPKAVFLSYAREDTAAAQRIAEALRSHGVEVWFDQNELRGGDAWDAKIRKQIKECALFMPIISAQCEERREGYFRREWNLAVDRTLDMAHNAPFLVPVVIDGTSDGTAHVPDKFRTVQWMRLPKALPTPQFVEQVERLLAAPRKSASPQRAQAQSGSPAATAAARSGFPVWILIGLGALAISLCAYFLLRPSAKETLPAPPQVAVEPKPVPAASAPQATDKSIAVLPFENMSDDKANTAFFSDGMQEDILTNLANIRELRVVSRTSVEQYRTTTKSVPQIARELGVAYILEGSVRRAGDKVRITGQLIRAATDEHLWARRYDRDLTPKDMFDIQEALSTEIANALQAAISPDEKSLLERRPTDNLAAYDLYLKGRDARNHSTRNGRVWLRQAEKYFKGAVDIDPNFAVAWAELANVYAYLVFWNFDRTPARLAQADAAIGRAVRLEPDAPEINLLLGEYAYHGYRDYARATGQFEKMIRLKPNDTDALFYLGAVQGRQGHLAECLATFHRVTALDPGNAYYASNLAFILGAVRRWDGMLAEQRRIVGLLPDQLRERVTLARMAFMATGSTAEADDWLARLAPAQLELPRIIDVRKWLANMKGDYAEWKRLDGMQPYFDEDETPHWSQAVDAAMILAAHGDMAGAHARLGSFPGEVRSALQFQPDNASLWRELSRMEALLGQNEDALRDARKAAELIPETRDALSGPALEYNLAVVCAWTGDKDGAMAQLGHLLRGPVTSGYIGNDEFMSVHALRSDAACAPLRGDPRFETLLNDPKNNAPLF